jgi:hypothetical protein
MSKKNNSTRVASPVDTHVNPVGPVHTAETEGVETVTPTEPKKEEVIVKQPVTPVVKPTEERPTIKNNNNEVKYREVIYLGIANEAERVGSNR